MEEKFIAYSAIFKRIDLPLLEHNLIAFYPETKVIAIAKDETIFFYNTQTKEKITKLISREGTIASLFFLDANHILYTTKSGHLILSNYKSREYHIYLFRTVTKYKTQLPIEITAIARYRYFLAIGSVDGKVTLLHLHSYMQLKTLHYTDAPIATLTFSDRNRLIIIDIEGQIFTYDLQEKEERKKLLSHISHPKQLLAIPQSDFCIINTHEKSLRLFHSKENRVLKEKYLQFRHPISTIALLGKEELFIALQNRELHSIKLKDEESLEALIAQDMLPQAYNFVLQNPLLVETKSYNRLERAYNIKYLNALKCLQNAKRERANELLKEFATLPTTQEQTILLFQAYKNYENFQGLIVEQKFAPAYALALKYPPLQYSKEYKMMEYSYKEVSKKAQHEMLHTNPKKAKELLFPYFNILSKREGIELILKENDNLLRFLEALNSCDYSTVEALLHKTPHLKNLPPYEKFLHETLENLHTIEQLLNEAETTKAKEMIKKMHSISFIKKELQRLEQKADTIENLLSLYQQNRFKECYGLLDRAPELFLELKLAYLLERHWAKLMKISEKQALAKDMKGVKKSLGEFLTLKSRSKRVGELLRMSFIVEIEDKILEKKFVSAENFIYSYIDIFGEDANLTRVMQLYEQKRGKELALMPNSPEVSYDAWLHNRLIIA